MGVLKGEGDNMKKTPQYKHGYRTDSVTQQFVFPSDLYSLWLTTSQWLSKHRTRARKWWLFLIDSDKHISLLVIKCAICWHHSNWKSYFYNMDLGIAFSIFTTCKQDFGPLHLTDIYYWVTMHRALVPGDKEIKDGAIALPKEDFVMPTQPEGSWEIQSCNGLLFFLKG